MSEVKLTPRHVEALIECAKYEGQNWIYWFRKASMADLEKLGYVEQYRPKSLENSKRKDLPYRVTSLGRVLALGAKPVGRAALEEGGDGRG